jgi:GAF domain-containing protein
VADNRLDRSVEAFRAETTLPGLLGTATRELVEVFDAVACAISRVVGEVLIQVAEYALDGRTLVLGHGYLISDFPLTKAVLEHGDPVVCTLLNDDCDPSEAELLRELRLESLLMMPLGFGEATWGLAEVYANGRAFGEAEIALAQPLAEAFGGQLVQMPAPASRR